MRFHRSSLCSALVASSIFLSFPAAVFGQAPQTREAVDPAARAAFEAGRDAYDRGRFGEALQQFDRAYALSPNPILLYNIGRAAEADLQNERAVQAYEAYLAALERAENREFVEARLAKLRQVTRQQAAASTPTPAPMPAPPAPVQPSSPVVTAPAAPPTATYVTPAGLSDAATPRKSIPGFRLYGGFGLGVGGELEIEFDDEERSGSFDLAPTRSIQVGFGYAWRFFGIGGEVRTNWIKPSYDEDEDAKREKTFDVVVKPRGGYQFRNIPLEFYGALPVGLSLPRFEEGEEPERIEFQAGATVGFVAGASYFFTKHFGLNAELGWTLHVYRFTDWNDDQGTLAISQLRPLNINAMLAF